MTITNQRLRIKPILYDLSHLSFRSNENFKKWKNNLKKYKNER